MTNQILAAQKLESLVAGGTVSIAAIKLESSTKEISPTSIGAMKIETNIDATTFHKIGTLHLETLLTLGGFAPEGAIPNTFRPNPVPCIPPPHSRFKKFWTTQPEACPPEQGECPGDICIRPGLSIIPQYDPTWQMLSPAQDGGGALPECGAPIIGASIANNDYVRGLVLNILGTNASQAQSICGQIPGQRLGYWLDDITGVSSGSSIRYVPTKGYSVNQQVQFIQMQANVDMQKLVKYGVANSVTVKASYVGNSTVKLVITIYGSDDETTVVNSTVANINNAWVWNT